MRKSQPVRVVGYGERIRRAVLLWQGKSGRKATLADVGARVAVMIGRDKPFTAGTVSGWVEERSEPPLAVFLAIAQWAGVHVGYLAFGDVGKDAAETFQPATETPEGYYADVTKPAAPKAAAAKKLRGA